MQRILASLVVFALVVAACGSSDEEPPATAAEAPATTAPAANTTEAPVAATTTAAPVVTTTEAPVVTTTTAAPIVTTTTAAPPEEPETPEAPATPAAVEGTLLEGTQPEGLVNLQSSTNTPLAEICPGIATYGEIQPVAYSAAVWARDLLTGPFLDVWIARFESAEVASEALSVYGEGLIACGEFTEPATGAFGSFSIGTDPALGDESFGVDYNAVVSGLPVTRYGTVVRIGDSMYSAGLAAVFVEPDVAAVLHSINAILGL